MTIQSLARLDDDREALPTLLTSYFLVPYKTNRVCRGRPFVSVAISEQPHHLLFIPKFPVPRPQWYQPSLSW